MLADIAWNNDERLFRYGNHLGQDAGLQGTRLLGVHYRQLPEQSAGWVSKEFAAVLHGVRAEPALTLSSGVFRPSAMVVIETTTTAGGCQLPFPAGKIEGGVSLGQ